MSVIYSLKNVVKSRVVDGAGFRLKIPSVEIKAQENVALVGHSGCGKSTLLDMLALALSAIFFGLLTIQSWQDAVEKFIVGERSMGGSAEIIIWPGRFFLPLGCGLLTLLLIVKLIRRPLTEADMVATSHDMTGEGTK